MQAEDGLLVPCDACTKPMSMLAKMCTHCGHPRRLDRAPGFWARLLQFLNTSFGVAVFSGVVLASASFVVTQTISCNSTARQRDERIRTLKLEARFRLETAQTLSLEMNSDFGPKAVRRILTLPPAGKVKNLKGMPDFGLLKEFREVRLLVLIRLLEDLENGRSELVTARETIAKLERQTDGDRIDQGLVGQLLMHLEGKP